MKKLSAIVMAMMMAVGMQAQVKVAPKMQKGAQVTYKNAVTMNMPGLSEPIALSYLEDYTIVDETADGYILKVETRDFSSNVKDDDVMGTIVAAATELGANLTRQYKVNKQGQVTGYVDYEATKKEAEAYCDKLVNTINEKMPEVGTLMPVDALKEQISEKVTEEGLVNQVKAQPGVLCLNGRTIMTGAQEDYANEQDMKMKRMYLLTSTDGKMIRTSATLNMTKDEIKQMIIKEIEQAMPDQAEAIKQNIDMMIDSGMMKMDLTETADYTLRDDQWVKTLSVETKTNTMGQESTTTATLEFVSSNF